MAKEIYPQGQFGERCDPRRSDAVSTDLLGRKLEMALELRYKWVLGSGSTLPTRILYGTSPRVGPVSSVSLAIAAGYYLVELVGYKEITPNRNNCDW